MKKLKLKLQNIEGAGILTREQLKTVMGGSDDDTKAACVQCTDDSSCRSTQECRESSSCFGYGKVCARKYWA